MRTAFPFLCAVVIAAAAALVVPSGAAARPVTLGGVEGAGFYRVGEERGPGKSKATKEMLLIRAFRGEDDDRGTAVRRSHAPGKGKPTAVMVQVDCVRVGQAADGTKTVHYGLVLFNNTAVKGLVVDKETKTTSALLAIESGQNQGDVESLKAVGEAIGNGIAAGMKKAIVP